MDIARAFAGKYHDMAGSPRRKMLKGVALAAGATLLRSVRALAGTQRPASTGSFLKPYTERYESVPLGDQPAKSKKEDRLGFGVYVNAVSKFLTDSSTKIPLTLSIEGLWGTGKSSFMMLLQEALKDQGKKKIVAFNAWQYNADDGLWAAFIHEFDEKLYDQLG
jgi:hypothetical protein